MAEHKRNAGTNQPISRHPLFPAIVALWFGALFGLGSVMISPAVIERAVLAAGIDRVIPMAAPPLGTTMRILLALAMTGVGGLIGALLGRRLARPAPPAAHVRRRVAAPAPAVDEPSAAPAAPAGRRRALAMEEDVAPVVAEERAPIPGRDAHAVADHAPQILDMSEFDLDGFEDAHGDRATAAPAAWAAPAPAEEPAGSAGEPAWLEAESAWREPVAEQQGSRGAFVMPPAGAQIFGAPVDKDDLAPQAGDPADDDSEVTALPFAAPEPQAARPSGASLFDTYSRELAVRAGTARPERVNPLFAAPTDAAPQVVVATTEPGFALLPRLDAGTPEVDNQIVDIQHLDGTAVAAPVEVAEALEIAPDAAEPAIAAQPEAPVAPPAGSAAERIAGAELGALSQVELLERLALAMEQRREENRRAAAAPVVAAVPAPVLASVPSAAAEPAVLREVSSIAAEAPQGDLNDTETPHNAAEEPHAPVADDTMSVTVDADEAIPFAAPEAFEAPAPLAPAPFAVAPQPEADDAAPAPRVLPAALRPVGFDDDFDDSESLPAYIPPRHIGLTLQPPASETEAFDGAELADDDAPAPAALADGFDDGLHDELDGDDAAVLEQGYSSLLNLSRQSAPRQQFVRIDEPEETGEIQPLVIFPGEDARESGPFARPALAAEPAAPVEPAPAPAAPGAERLFDAPARHDPEETERALRAALATLQRMSGAA